MKSNCCQAEMRIAHGCDDDMGHGGKPCTCMRDNPAVTCWYECVECGKPCDPGEFTLHTGNAVDAVTGKKIENVTYAMEKRGNRTHTHTRNTLSLAGGEGGDNAGGFE